MQIWAQIYDKLSKRKAVGRSLTLQCPMHKMLKEIQTPDHFQKYFESDCNLPCLAICDCGHKCLRKCHFFKPEGEKQHAKCLSVLCTMYAKLSSLF